MNFAADPAAARQVLATRDCPVLVVPASSCIGLKISAADLVPLPPVLRRVLWRWLACCRLGRGLDHFVAWDLLPALALTHPELLEMREVTVELGEAGVLSVAPEGRHGLVLEAAGYGGGAGGAARRLGLNQAAGQIICAGSACRVLSGLAPRALGLAARAAAARFLACLWLAWVLGMECICCGSAAISERPNRTAQGYRRFRCRDCGKEFNERSAGLLNRAQYPSDVIALVVLWRLRYRLTLRDLAEMFRKRGIIFSHEAVRDWEAKLASILADELRRRRHNKGGTRGRHWHVDETYLKVRGRWTYLYRV